MTLHTQWTRETARRCTLSKLYCNSSVVGSSRPLPCGGRGQRLSYALHPLHEYNRRSPAQHRIGGIVRLFVLRGTPARHRPRSSRHACRQGRRCRPSSCWLCAAGAPAAAPRGRFFPPLSSSVHTSCRGPTNNNNSASRDEL